MEISRNSDIGQYMLCIAQRKYKSRLHKFEMTKIEGSPELQEYIADSMINKKWSPDAISGRMKLESHQETISTESIYIKTILYMTTTMMFRFLVYLYSSPMKNPIFNKNKGRIIINNQ